MKERAKIIIASVVTALLLLFFFVPGITVPAPENFGYWKESKLIYLVSMVWAYIMYVVIRLRTYHANHRKEKKRFFHAPLRYTENLIQPIVEIKIVDNDTDYDVVFKIEYSGSKDINTYLFLEKALRYYIETWEGNEFEVRVNPLKLMRTQLISSLKKTGGLENYDFGKEDILVEF